MELPKRKPTRLKGYDYSTPGAYFVTICTQNREYLFEMETAGNDLCVVPPLQNQIIHKWLRETENKFDNIKIEKYVIMPNHIHLIVLITERHAGRSLHDVMRWFETMVTNEYIRNVKKGILKPFNKKIFQKSFHEHIIRGENDYKKIWEYIDTNPLKWELDCLYNDETEM